MTSARRCVRKGMTGTMNRQQRKKRKDEAGRASAAKTWSGKPLPTATPLRRRARVGRNALCPCKSGKKFKHCCAIQKTHKPPRPRVQEVRTPPGETRHDIANSMRRAKMRPECVYAYEKTGILVTTMNRDALPAATVAEWDAAVKEYEKPATE